MLFLLTFSTFSAKSQKDAKAKTTNGTTHSIVGGSSSGGVFHFAVTRRLAAFGFEGYFS